LGTGFQYPGHRKYDARRLSVIFEPLFMIETQSDRFQPGSSGNSAHRRAEESELKGSAQVLRIEIYSRKYLKRQIMQWLTTGMETNIAYGSCMLLFGLLVLSVRNRKMENKVSHTFYVPPVRSRRQTAVNYKTEQMLRRKAPVQPAGVLVKRRIEAATCEPSNINVPEAAAIQFPEPSEIPAEIPAPKISDEVKMNFPSFPFVSLDPISLADISAFSEPPIRPAIPETEVSPLFAYGLLELEESKASEAEKDAARDTQMEEGKASATAVETNVAEPVAADETGMFSVPESFDTNTEKPTGANLLSYFGLSQQPFDVTPDPACLYLSGSHSEALTALKQGIEHFRGFMMLVAEPGMGKTTLMHRLMEELAESARVVFLFQTQCNSRELLCYILNELQVDHSGMDAVAMHRALNQALLEEMLRGRKFVLIVDEAQNLQEPVLETIRLLSDFETTHSKLIQIVLAGQPQLAETLMRGSLVQLRQRIAVLSSLKSLSVAETAEYVDYRLRASGWSGKQIFSADALVQIAESSGGVPRSINNYCFGAMLKAFQRGLQAVDADIVKEVAGTLNLESLVRSTISLPAYQQSVETTNATLASQIEQDFTDIPNTEASVNANAAPFIGPLPNPEIILTGNLTEKVRSQGWSKRHEYRILVTLERDLVSGVPIADRYYCCSIYVDETQAALLKPGKPVRIKIEQD
jgi:type II secretory pathway predicted ATPase ExeA